MTPYWADETTSLYLGDCREVKAWLEADVLVTDPPYGITWTASSYGGNRTRGGIANDGDTAARDDILALFGPDRPALVFGSPSEPFPFDTRQTLVWAKPPDSGLFGSVGGWRRDWEAIYMLGSWPTAPAARSAIIRSGAGGLATYVKRGHPHGKPIDVMEYLIATCPLGVIADPFAGSGTTLLAARNQGRKSIGVEIDERYCEIAARRLSQGVLDFEDVS